MVGIRTDRMKSEDVIRLCGVKKSLGRHMDKNLLRWYGLVKHMEEDRLVKTIYRKSLVYECSTCKHPHL